MKKIMFVSLLFLAGCANPYRANFNSTWERYPNWMESRLSSKSNHPRLMVSDAITTENWKMYEQGYIMVGFSKFDGADVDTKLALTQAKTIGADVALVQKKYAKTLTETVTVTQWPPDETTEVRERTTTPRGKPIERRVEITTSRGPETVYVPKQVDYYEHSATYWRKLEKPVFGAFVQDLSDDQKQKLQSNHGLVVRAVMTDSPAHDADLLKGDIIVKLDGQPAPSAQKFYAETHAKAGQQITLSILRGTAAFDRRIKLNP
jgi:hypothetical protein